MLPVLTNFLVFSMKFRQKSINNSLKKSSKSKSGVFLIEDLLILIFDVFILSFWNEEMCDCAY